MTRFIVLGIFLWAAFQAGTALAQPVSPPAGWSDETSGNTRILSNGTSRISVGPWTELSGQPLRDWLAARDGSVKPGMQFVSSGGVKSDRLPGSFAILQEVRFDGRDGYSILYACPGGNDIGRLLRLDVHKEWARHMLSAATFGENICTEGVRPGEIVVAAAGEQPQTEPPAPTDGNDLAALNARIPKGSAPESAAVVLEKSFRGFPAILVHEAVMEARFPNGYATTCMDWNPAALSPAPASAGRALPDCDFTRTPRGGKAIRPFSPGQTLDLHFGNVSASGFDFGASSSASLSGGDIVMTRDGRIAIGGFQAAAVSSGGNGAGGGGKTRTLTGRYYLNGYTITIASQGGEIFHGFIGHNSDGGSGGTIDHLFLNGDHFWERP